MCGRKIDHNIPCTISVFPTTERAALGAVVLADCGAPNKTGRAHPPNLLTRAMVTRPWGKLLASRLFGPKY